VAELRGEDRQPAAAVAAVRAWIGHVWLGIPPEAVRDAMCSAATTAWRAGVTTVPAASADQTAEWMLEMTGEWLGWLDDGHQAAEIGARMPAPVAFASSVALDRDEDAATLTTLATLLVLACTTPADEDALGRAG
jgi:hypothetical protein